MDNSFVGIVFTAVVFYGLYFVLGPRKVKRRTARRRKTVRVDPLVARERRLAAELRTVRAQIRQNQEVV